MTILVGILAEDGVVVGADSMASLQTGVAQSNTKVHTIENKAVFACAGDDRLNNEFIHHLNVNKEIFNQSTEIHSLSQLIGSTFATSLIEKLKEYPVEMSQPIIENIAINGFNFGALLAIHLDGKHHLVTFDGFLNPNVIRNNGVWHVIVGSGASVAEPSIHLVKKLLQIENQPNINKAQLLAYWTIEHAIEVSCQWIGGAISLCSLIRNTSGAYTVSYDETNEYKSAINDIYHHIHQYEYDDLDPAIEIPTLDKMASPK